MMELSKMSKPLLEKRRRARITNSLEQLRTLLEEHHCYNVRERKLDQAEVLELAVKHVHNFLRMRQDRMAPVYQEGILKYQEGFKDCLVDLRAYVMKTKTSQETLNLMLGDQLNAIAPQTRAGHLQNVLISPSPKFLGESNILHPSHQFKKMNTWNSEAENGPMTPPRTTILSEASSITQEARRDQQVFFTQHIHGTGSPSSFPGNLHPPSSCQQPTNACWRPW
ncbi:transcription factor HES-2-like [Ranitomeya variabilis]|uniref:transcription factor HES-2-like n=1 Tax=Ranitomeya variabilis TaxID=490064 RepID=UPI0040561780